MSRFVHADKANSTRIVVLALFLSSLFFDASICAAQDVPVVTGNTRVDQLLNQMTLEEKIIMIHGAPEDQGTDTGAARFAWFARLGIPGYDLADGPPGVLTKNPSTALTATMGLAATFSTEDALQNGIVVGRDARALGINVSLQPFINMYRDIGFHRGYNLLGEDPLLTGRIGAALIRGIQSQAVMANAKTLVGYDGTRDVTVDQQTLREIYMAPYVDFIDAEVASVMCAYSRVNGTYACNNDDVQNKILRGEMGFKGFICSDWGAVHRTDYINHGLDLEMPGAPVGSGPGEPTPYFLAETLPGATGDFTFNGRIPEEISADKSIRATDDAEPIGMLDAVRSGLVKQSTITRAVGRILGQMDRFGFLDGKIKHDITSVPVELDAKVVQKTSEDAAVLLKNEGDALPLRDEALKSLVLIGPGAGQTVAVGRADKKALGIPSRQVSPYQVLKNYLAGDKGANIGYAVGNDMTGTTIPAAVLSHDSGAGLLRVSKDDKQASPQIDDTIDFTLSNEHALPAGSSWTWYGKLTVPSDGDYMLHLQALAASAKLTIDGDTIAKTSPLFQHGEILHPNQDDLLPTTDGLDNVRTRIKLTAGEHVLQVSAVGEKMGQPVQIRLNWVTPSSGKQTSTRLFRLRSKHIQPLFLCGAAGVPSLASLRTRTSLWNPYRQLTRILLSC